MRGTGDDSEHRLTQDLKSGKPNDQFGDFFEGYPERKHNALISSRQRQRLDQLYWTREQGYYTYQQALDKKSGPRVTIDGESFLMMSSYDYLGLLGNNSIENAAIKAIQDFGTGAAGVRLLTGTNKLHLQLETKIAEFKGTEGAVTFTSGYAANLAVMSSLLTTKDIVLIDSKIHQSTVDACKLAGVPFRRFGHNNMDILEKLLNMYASTRKVLIISEGIFSMDGDICTLPQIVALKKKYGAFLMIDEAHSFGVLGPSGRGVNFHLNVPSEDIDVFTGSLSKAIPANGGFVAGPKELIIFLQHGSSPYIFSSAMAPAAVATALEALKVCESDPGRTKQLRQKSEYFRNRLSEHGFDTGLSQSPVVPVIFGGNESTLRASRILYDNQILAVPVIYPAVAHDQGRLRICVTSAHTQEMLDEAVQGFLKI